MGLYDSKVKHQSIADKITIKTPEGFKESIKQLEKGGLSKTEYKGLVLAQNRAVGMLGRKNLSEKERKEDKLIGKINIPSWRNN